MRGDPSAIRAQEVLDVWFEHEGEHDYGEFREVWFREDPDFDELIRDRFEALYEEAEFLTQPGSSF